MSYFLGLRGELWLPHLGRAPGSLGLHVPFSLFLQLTAHIWTSWDTGLNFMSIHSLFTHSPLSSHIPVQVTVDFFSDNISHIL